MVYRPKIGGFEEKNALFSRFAERMEQGILLKCRIFSTLLIKRGRENRAVFFPDGGGADARRLKEGGKWIIIVPRRTGMRENRFSLFKKEFLLCR